MKELHLIIIWEKGRTAQERIIADIQEHFIILKRYEIEWSRELVANNFSRFYGTHLPPDSFKEVECGTGAFLLFVVYDNAPVYAERPTSRGVEVVNINLFDAKSRYREWTNGGHKIHATNNPRETDHDLTLLLGMNSEDFLKQVATDSEFTTETLHKDIVGAKGWQSLKQLFYVLNSTVEYVMLRGKNEVANNYFPDEHRDVDLFLTRSNHSSAVFIINGVSACSTERPHELITINGEDYYIDMWPMENYYFDWGWSLRILQNRKLENGLYVLDENNEFYTLLYHCLVFKGKIAPDYLPILEHHRERLHLIGKKWDDILYGFITQNEYDITLPLDKSISMHYEGKIKDLVYRYGTPVKYLVAADKDFYFSAVYEKEYSFVKVGTTSLIKNEHTFLQELSRYEFAPRVIAFKQETRNKSCLEISRVAGESPITFFSSMSHLQRKAICGFVKAMSDILIIMAKHQIIHRDCTPSNLLVSEKSIGGCKVGLIDWGWAIKRNELETCICPPGLGNEYTSPRGFSDIYSFDVILSQLALNGLPYIIKVRQVLSEIIKKEAEGDSVKVTIEGLKQIKKIHFTYRDYLMLNEMHTKASSNEIYIPPFFSLEHLAVSLHKIRKKSFVPKFISHAFEKVYIYSQIKRSGLFDAKWYVQKYPEVRNYRKSALSHYLKKGFQLGYDPSVRFSTKLYEEAYPEVRQTGVNPLVHYLLKGRKQNYHCYERSQNTENE